MRTAGRSFTCLASSASYLPSTTLRRFVTLDCAREAKARRKAASAWFRSGI